MNATVARDAIVTGGPIPIAAFWYGNVIRNNAIPVALEIPT